MNFSLTTAQEIQFENELFLPLVDVLAEGKQDMLSHLLKKESADLFLHDASVKKFFQTKTLYLIAKTLSGKNSLRLGFDRLLSPQIPFEQREMQAIGSIQGIEIGALLPLAPDERDPSPFPKSKEDVTFIAPSLLLQKPHGTYRLIAFANPRARYVLNEKDPFTNDLKQKGYAFGDRLRDDTHPPCHR